MHVGTPSTQLKLTQKDQNCLWSPDGSHIAITGYGNGARILDAATGKKRQQFKIKGRPSETSISHHAFSPDGRLYAFSCAHAVYVGDLSTGDIVQRFELPDGERAGTVPVAFAGTGRSILVPDGDGVRLLSLDGRLLQRFEIPGGGDCMQLVGDAAGRRFAYCANAHPVCDQLVVIDIVAGVVSPITVPYDYVPGRAMFEMAPRFLDDGRIVVFHKTHGVFWFNPETLEQADMVSWAQIGARSFFHVRDCQASSDGRWLAFTAEESENPDPAEWSVAWPDGSRLFIYDVEAGRGVHLPSVGGGGITFRPDDAAVARITLWTQDSGRLARRLDIFDLSADSAL